MKIDMIYYKIWSSTLIQKQISLNCRDIYKSYILQSISEKNCGFIWKVAHCIYINTP